MRLTTVIAFLVGLGAGVILAFSWPHAEVLPRAPRTDALSRAHDVLWFTGLGEARYRLVEEFSTGMQQRTKLAMSLVHDPDLACLQVENRQVGIIEARPPGLQREENGPTAGQSLGPTVRPLRRLFGPRLRQLLGITAFGRDSP